MSWPLLGYENGPFFPRVQLEQRSEFPIATEMPRRGTVLWWIRRDLRLHDNEALAAALAAGERVLPVFVLDPALLRRASGAEKRLAFLFGGLRALDAELQARGSRLLLRSGAPAEVLLQLAREVGAHSVFAEADASPYAARRDAAVAALLPLTLTAGLTVHPPELVLKPDGGPYSLFRPFRKAWQALPFPGEPLPAPASIPTPGGLTGQTVPSLPTLPEELSFVPGEAEAWRRLAAFLAGPVYAYADDRNRLDLAGTSGLSPYLRFGMLSARAASAAAQEALRRAPDGEARRGAETWQQELIWREFYLHVLYHHPNVLREAFRPELRAIRWSDDETLFAAWCDGRTGYPVVDAAMRQLVASGWMHNRARMITASFLAKDLLIDWRRGERFFWHHLVDADPAANNGGWQWSAGTGTDAAPYFRLFNPVLQGRKFDPDGHFVRHWLPELAAVPTSHIHAPWTLPLSEQQRLGCVIGRHYPAPIVDHATTRARVLAAYTASRTSADSVVPG